ncbi:uncharacterized protein LOC143074273 [Mytilus galloprovincialis]|uniref:uncharacterized protein LOC143074273 n=1 Tax=Mytilus galloprovincialis TaxID=29158 RepID=UPI003F7C9B1A
MMFRDVIGLLYMLSSCAFADINIASKKPTKMSSIYDPKVGEGVDYLCCNSSYANDGVMPNSKRQAREDFLCAHTHRNDNQQQWWTNDLQNIYDISVINIYGRTDCCPDHLTNLDVEVIMPSCACNRWNNLHEGDVFLCPYQNKSSYSITITCPPNTRGRFVRIKRKDTEYLALCEVEVYGHPVNSVFGSGLSRTNTSYACGHIGYGYEGPVIGTSVEDSPIQCTRKCITKTACSAAEYDKNTHVCILKGECTGGTQSSLFPDNNKDVYFIQ